MPPKNSYFFVYGTLKSGFRAFQFLSNFEHIRKEATTKGILYSINDSFPGMVLNKTAIVHGELIIAKKSDESEITKILDVYEGFYPQRSKIKSLYLRKAIQVQSEKKNYKAWAYIFNQGIENYNKIKNGVWPLPEDRFNQAKI